MTYNIGQTPDNLKPISDRNNPAIGVFKALVVDADDDVQRMGRLRVWIPEFGGAPNLPKYCFTVSYASPFAGATPVANNEASPDGQTQQSYGMWFVPPDPGNEVLVCFVNGDTARGYWFACVYQQNMNHMVPAISAETSTAGSYEAVQEYNKKDTTITDYTNPPRKRFSPLADGIKLQGLADDPRRGFSTTSARRAGKSKAYGHLTPRGNSIHIDDNEDNEFIRLRTRSGVGITIHETDGFVHIISKNGKSHIEIGDQGIDFYTEQPMNMRTTGDYNIQSLGDVNIDAGRNLNIFATGHIAVGSGQQTYLSTGSDLVLGSGGDTSIKSGNNILMTAADLIGLGATGKLMMNGNPITQGFPPPIAPDPIPPVRHPMPDGPGGLVAGSSIGSRMPFAHPYDPAFANNDATPSGRAGVVPPTVLARANALYPKLKKRGYTDIQIAAILGVWQQESTLDPTKAEKGGSGIGLAQWSSSRHTALLAFADTKNLPWDDADTQLLFFDYEMRTSQKRNDLALRSATTLADAQAAMAKYEAFGIKGNRDQYGVAMLAQITAGKVA